jgi:hypothetical protein
LRTGRRYDGVFFFFFHYSHGFEQGDAPGKNPDDRVGLTGQYASGRFEKRGQCWKSRPVLLIARAKTGFEKGGPGTESVMALLICVRGGMIQGTKREARKRRGSWHGSCHGVVSHQVGS